MDEITLISLIVLGVALLLPVLTEKLADHHHLLTQVKYYIFAAYVLTNLYETLLFRVITPEAKYEMGFLWSYREALSLHKAGGFRILITDGELLKEIILNILLYIPLGYLLPFTWPKLAQKKREVTSGNRVTRWLRSIPWKVVLIGFLCSTFTEVTQLVFHLGLFEFDDILNNTIGCVLGTLLYNALLRRHTEQSGTADIR